MKNWTVTFYVPERIIKRDNGAAVVGSFKINEYVTAETGIEAVKIAEASVRERYERATFWELDECTTDPETAKAYDELCSEEYDHSADDIRESLTHERLGLMYTTCEIYDERLDNGAPPHGIVVEDLDIQVYLNTSTDKWEVWTAGESELVETIDRKDAPAMWFDDMYYEFAGDVRRWWVEHPEELKDWYDVTLPEGFEL